MLENTRQAKAWKHERRRAKYQRRKPVHRITAAYSREEIAAIRWLSRSPARPELRGRFATLRCKAQRQIARALSDAELQKLVQLFERLHPERTENPGVGGSIPPLPNLTD